VSTFSPARRVNSIDELERAGDYWLTTVLWGEEVRREVFFLLPLHEGKHWGDRPTRGSGIHGAPEPPWTIVEHPDGSVEVQGSIACGRGTPEGQYFHGYLRAGNVWETLPG
jgi:hypothetical protein